MLIESAGKNRTRLGTDAAKIRGQMEIPTASTIQSPAKLTRFSSVLQNLIIVSLAALLCLPCLVHGLPPVGDSTLHATYQYQFSGQFWKGEIYPRWMVSANKGYGSPIFLIQYPLPYWVTALLRPLTRFSASPARESRELGVFCFLVLAVAGLSARLWLRRSRDPFAATAAAMVYISLPYLLAYGVYSDLAIGQLATFAWMPLALTASDSLRLRFTAVSALGIVWALLMLTNLLTALIFAPLMIGYAITRRQSNHLSLVKCIVSVAVSLVIGTCLAAVYIFPFVANLRLFNINALLSRPGYELSHHLSFVRLESLGKPVVVIALIGALTVAVIAARYSWRAGGSVALRVCMLLTLGLGALLITPDLGLRLIGLSGLKPPVFKVVDYFPERLLAMGLLTIALGVFAYSQIPQEANHRRDYTLLLLIVAACGSFMLMLPWSAFLWKALPVVGTAIQFPHRLCVLLTIAVTGLLAAAIDNSLRRRANGEGSRPALLMAFMAVAVIAGGVFTWRADRTWRDLLRNPPVVHADETHDVDHTYRTYVSQDHLAEFAKLIGAVPNNDRVQPAVDPGTARLVQGQGVVNVVRQSPRKLLVSYTVSGQGLARIGLVYSPLWRIQSTSGASVSPILGISAEGLVEVPLIPGRHDLELVFDGGWPERYGVIVTFISIVFVSGGMLIQMAVSKSGSVRQMKIVGVPGNGHEIRVHE